MKTTILSAILAGGLAVGATAAVVNEAWILPGGSGTASGNIWLNESHAGRGIDFIPAAAAQNTFGEDVIVVADGVTGTSDIHILAADDGQNKGSFAMTATGDSTIDHYRLATSDDGYIFVNGYSGTVQQYTPAGALTVAVPSSVYGTLSPAVTGNSRALEVTGSVAAGTAKIMVGRGQTIVVFGNTPEATGTFSYLGQVSLVAPFAAADISSIASHNGSLVYVVATSGVAGQKLTISYSPAFSANLDGPTAQYAVFVKQGIAVNAAGTKLALAEAGGTQDGFAIANITPDGITWNNIAPAPGLDGDADALYDAGTLNLDCGNAVNDIAMDPATGETYGYSSSTVATPVASGAIFKLFEDVSSVDAWSLY